MKKKYEEIAIIFTLLYIIVSPLYFNYSNLFIKTTTVITTLKIIWLVSELFLAIGYFVLYKDKLKNLKRIDILILIFPFLYALPIIFGNNVQSLFLNFEYIIISLFIAFHIVILRRLLNKKNIEYILKTIVLSGIISLLLSFLVQSNYDLGSTLQISSWFGDFYKSSVDRLYGTLLYPNAYGTFMLAGYFITFNYIIKQKANSIVSHICLFLLSLGFLLTISKIMSLIFVIINFLWLIYLIYIKEYKNIFKILSFFLSITIPILYVVNKTRIFTYNNNFISYFIIIMLMFTIYYLLYKLFSKLSLNKKSAYIILGTVIICIAITTFAFPKNQNLKIDNVVATSNVLKNNSIVFSDLMNLQNSTSYLIKVKINSQTELHNPILKLKVLYINKNKVIKKEILSYTILPGDNFYYFDIKTRSDFDFYYLELQDIDIYNSLEIGDIEVKDLFTGKIVNYAVDNILMPYTYIHSISQIKYDKGSAEGRIKIYKEALSISKNHVIVGQGFRTYTYYTSSNNDSFKPTDEHSFVMRMLLELGIIGVIYYLILIIYGIIFVLRILKDSKTISAIMLFLLSVGSSLFDINLSYEFLHFLLLLSLILLNYYYDNLKNKKKVMFIASAGGHLTELLAIDNIFSNYDYILITEKNKISNDIKSKYKIRYLLYGSRYYKVKYFFVSIINVFKDIYYFIRYNPDVIYTTGAHNAVLLCYLGYLFDRKIIFVEVFDRTNTPTLSGRLIYPIATTFIVQHNNYNKIYPHAKYIKGVY